MPLNIPAGSGLATFELGYAGDNELMFTTLGVQALGQAPLGVEEAARCFDAFVDGLLPSLCDEVTLRAVILRVRQDGGGDTIFEHRPGTPAVGGTAGEPLPQNVAALIRKNTARAGRRGRGRMFLPGFPEANVTAAGALTTSAFNALVTGCSTFLARLQDLPSTGEDPITPVLFHDNATSTTRTVSGNTTTITITEGAQGPLPDVITSFSPDPRVATQRRRLR